MTPLRQRMLEDMRVRNLARNTQLSYLQQVSAFARHFQKSPQELGPEEIRAYQVHLATVKKLAPSTCCLVAGALRFLFRVTLKKEWTVAEIPMPKKPLKLPVILSREEVTPAGPGPGSFTPPSATSNRFAESILRPTRTSSVSAARTIPITNCFFAWERRMTQSFPCSRNWPVIFWSARFAFYSAEFKRD